MSLTQSAERAALNKLIDYLDDNLYSERHSPMSSRAAAIGMT